MPANRPQQIFTEAETRLAQKQYSKAIAALEALDALYPFGKHTEQSQLDLIYAYYISEDYVSAAMTADRFTRVFPRSKHVDYAYYLKGLANFEPTINFIEKRIHTDVSLRDDVHPHQAYRDFNNLVTRFPNSKYAPDARKHMLFLRDQFARHELNVAEFYMRRKLYVAAINRASDVVSHYQQSPQVKPALQLMVKAYRALGLTEQAKQSQELLTLNFPS